MLGLRSFVTGNQQNATIASPRRAPRKIVADEEAYQGRRYTSVEPSEDNGSERGVFSTDMGSYPETSTNNTLERFVYPAALHENTAQQHQQIAHRATDSYVSTEHATQNLHEHDTQAFNDFERDWDEDMQYLETTGGDVRPVESQGVHLEKSNIVSQAVVASKNGLSMKAQPAQTLGSLAQNGAIDIAKAATENNGHVNPAFSQSRSRFARPIVPVQSSSQFVYQSNGRPKENYREQVVPDSQPNASEVGESVEQPSNKQRSKTNIPVVSEYCQVGTQTLALQDRWKLKRKASLSHVKLDMADRALHATSYSDLKDRQDASEEDNEIPDLEALISNIVDEHYSEDDLVARIAKLSKERWIDLGDKLSTETNKIVSELKDLRNKKHDVSNQFEKEIGEMMLQVENNDRCVEARLQHLRQSGAQMLGQAVSPRNIA